MQSNSRQEKITNDPELGNEPRANVRGYSRGATLGEQHHSSRLSGASNMASKIWARLVVQTTIALASLSMSTPALADWVPFDQDDDGVVYIDSSSATQGDLRTVRLLIDRRQPTYFKVLSSVGVIAVDCRQKKTRVLSSRNYADHMGSGQVLEANEKPEDWEQPDKGSRSERAINRVCAM
jgi:hypothetical protein